MNILLAAVLIGLSIIPITLVLFRLISARKEFNLSAMKKRLAPEGFQQAEWQSNSVRKKANISEILFFRTALNKLFFVQKLSSMLSTVKWRISVSVFILISALLSIVSYIFFKDRIPVAWAGAFLSLAIGCVPFLILSFSHKRYLNKFEAYLPESLGIMSNALKIGHGFESCMEVVSKTAPYPANREFSTVKAEVQLGISLQQALNNLYLRLRLPELKILKTGIAVHNDLGGNLSEILDNLQKTIRERFALKREIKTLSAQGMLSAIVLFSIPLFTVAIWMTTDKEMFLGFLSTEGGMSGLKKCLVAEVIAMLWIKKVINIKD